MQFSCHTWGFNDLTLPEAMGTIARMGFRYVDIGTGPHVNIARAAAPATRADAIAEVQGDLEMFNLKVADLYLLLPRISVDDEPKRTQDINVFKALLPFAKSIGAAGITVSAGLIHPVEDTAAFERAAEALREMVTIAQKIELPVSIEPHLDSMAETPEQALKFVEAVPGLQITLDIAHMVCQRAKPKDMWALLPHTRHVQIRQAKAKRLQTPFDKGGIDLNEVMTALKDAHYNHFLSIEYMQTVDWHGMMKVNSLQECMKMRDALKALN
jgi:sugar phosphate isomerase/epimerase